MSAITLWANSGSSRGGHRDIEGAAYHNLVLNCLSLELPTLKGLIKKGILATAFCAKRHVGHIKIELTIGSLAPDRPHLKICRIMITSLRFAPASRWRGAPNFVHHTPFHVVHK
jgi:hypothetical protein